jgi:hypothetical protein
MEELPSKKLEVVEEYKKFSAQERSSGLGPPAPGLFITCR